MNKMIKININESFSKQITLKKILLLNVPCVTCGLEELDLQINIKPNVYLNLLDDYFIKTKIKFVLNENSKLEYLSKPNNDEKTLRYDLLCKSLRVSGNRNLFTPLVPSAARSDVYRGIRCFENYLWQIEKGCNSIDKELTFELTGSCASAKVKILCFGKKDQIFNFKTIQDHKIANTKSDLIIKGVFDDSSKLKSDNLIRVAQDAQNVQANQINKNILIGDQSRVITIPKLEIKADKVKCHHGAAVSKLNANQMFYIQSRGFDLNESKNMLISAFLN